MVNGGDNTGAPPGLTVPQYIVTAVVIAIPIAILMVLHWNAATPDEAAKIAFVLQAGLGLVVTVGVTYAVRTYLLSYSRTPPAVPDFHSALDRQAEAFNRSLEELRKHSDCRDEKILAQLVSLEERMRAREHARRSFELIQHFNRADAVRVRGLIEEVKANNFSPKDLFDKVQGDDQLTQAVKCMLGMLEDVAIAIDVEAADEDILRRSLESITLRLWTHLGPYVTQLRRERDDKELYSELEQLQNRWTRRARSSDPKRLST